MKYIIRAQFLKPKFPDVHRVVVLTMTCAHPNLCLGGFKGAFFYDTDIRLNFINKFVLLSVWRPFSNNKKWIHGNTRLFKDMPVVKKSLFKILWKPMTTWGQLSHGYSKDTVFKKLPLQRSLPAFPPPFRVYFPPFPTPFRGCFLSFLE